MSKPTTTVHFLGASNTVTGSKYLIDTGTRKILIDCGLFQGLKKLRLLNWEALPVPVQDIDLVLLTHGHLDHVGYLPRLVKLGYKRPILGTAPTLDVAEVILKDSAKIQMEEAARANEEGYSKHPSAKPLYDLVDSERAIDLFETVPEGEWIDLFEGIKARFNYNGHIIGATFIELSVRGEIFCFSGDVGRKEDALLYPPKKPQQADYLFLESTYGNRLHPKEDVSERLANIIQHTVAKGGTLIIPSFAVERAQYVMYLLWQLRLKKRIPEIPMIFDSPMGVATLNVFKQHGSWHKLTEKDCAQLIDSFTCVEDYAETWKVIANKKPKIVIAGSGMITGGRVLTYLQQYLHLPATTVLLVGFQGEGTRGRSLLEGASELKIYGKYIPVRAELFYETSLSSHGDQAELIEWVSEISPSPKKVFLVHGEPSASDALRVKLRDTYQWEIVIPELYQIEEF
jgi:metallo-beta-lactamase family protein